MHRGVLIAWLPWFACLLAAAGALWCVARFSGGRLELARLRRLHRCEGGAVQTLSFVFTLPIFVMLLMFIVQVADLMMAIGIVHYAAFAAARAASVWVPAEVWSQPGEQLLEPANGFDQGSMDAKKSHFPVWVCTQLNFGSSAQHWKYEKIWKGAALACVPLAPSHDLAAAVQSNSSVTQPIEAFYPRLVPASTQYPRLRQLIEKKVDYNRRMNTGIIISGIDRDGAQGPTYNPYPGHFIPVIDPVTGTPVDRWIEWNPLEVGWEDPVTVRVRHYFALLPGPGRFLARVLRSRDGTPDRVSPLISPSPSNERFAGGGQRDRVYTVELTADVTISNEGLKSVMPYAQSANQN